MGKSKRIKRRRSSSPLVDIILAPFFALMYSIPATIVATIVFFIFGLICGAVEPLAEAVDSFFNSLPFWNKKWEYAWTLYFGIIVGLIVEIISTIVLICQSSHDTPEHLHKNSKHEASVSYDPFDYMSLEEKMDYLIKNDNETFNEIWHGIPKTSHIKQHQEDMKNEWQQLRQDEFDRHYDNQRKLDQIYDELKQLNDK